MAKRRTIRTILFTILLLGISTLCLSPTVSIAACGDGVIEQNEECDPGGALHVEGNPSNATCTSGGNCFYALSCCKFNCQFANPGPCFDGNACTVNDSCDNVGNCLIGEPADENDPCDDGLYCTTTDVCDSNGTCVGSGSPCNANECQTACNENTQACDIDVGAPCTDDGNICTDDVCDAGGACTHPNNTAPCDDGLFCNGVDTCSGGSCDGHAGDPCAAGGQCNNQCDEAGDTCNLPNGSSCDDGLFCTEVDTCMAGSCVGSGDPCSGNSECNDSCDEAGDSCNDPAGTACSDDGNECTDDECDGSGSCLHPANLNPCNDGDLCTENDQCDGAGSCAGAAKDCGDGDLCTYDACDDQTGDCIQSVLGPSPVDQCRQASLSNLSIVDKGNDKADRLKWKWFRGDETSIEAFGDPTLSTTYELCVYDEEVPGQPLLKLRMLVPPNGLWTFRGSRAMYKDRAGLLDGAKVWKLFSGAEGKSKIGLKGKGFALDTPAPYIADQQFFAQNNQVSVQLSNTEGECWQSVFTETPVKNTGNKFKTLRKVLVGG